MKFNSDITIGIDLDNTVWDLLSAWLLEISKRTGIVTDPHTCDEYDIFHKYSMTELQKDISLEILEEKSFWDKVYLIPLAKEVINKLHKYNYNIYFVTNSSYKSAIHKVNKLKSIFDWVKDENVICIVDKHLLQLDYLIDDYYGNCGGYTTLTLKTPYIKEFEANARNYEVCDDWIDILSKIIEGQMY